MPRKLRKPRKLPDYRNDIEKHQQAIRAKVAKRNQLLAARRKALLALEAVPGAKRVKQKRHPSLRPGLGLQPNRQDVSPAQKRFEVT